MPESPYCVVLGVAQDGGHPQPGCRRDCCIGPSIRAHLTSCVAIVDRNRAWLLDAGPDLPRHLDVLDERGIDLAGILITHAHIGHYTGLMFLGKEAMDVTSLPVWAAPRMAVFLKSNGPWAQLVSAGNIEIRSAVAAIGLSPLVQVTMFPVPHRDEYSETVGYRVTGPQAALLYVPDTDGWDGWQTDIEDHLSAADVALLDGTFFSGDELPDRDITTVSHPTVSDSLRRFSNLNGTERSKIHFTHLNHTNPLLRTDSDEFLRVVRSGMAVATEGQCIYL